jgi:hypothetical protein
MQEKRKHERFEIPLEEKVAWPGHEEHIAVTRDFSESGALLLVVFDEKPAADTVKELQLISQVNGHDAPVLHARVVGLDANGTAFEFTPPQED